MQQQQHTQHHDTSSMSISQYGGNMNMSSQHSTGSHYNQSGTMGGGAPMNDSSMHSYRSSSGHVPQPNDSSGNASVHRAPPLLLPMMMIMVLPTARVLRTGGCGWLWFPTVSASSTTLLMPRE